MADILTSGFDFTGMLGTAGTAIKIGAVILAFAGMGYWAWNKRQYKYSVHLKVLKHDGFMTYDDTARELKVDGDVKYWKLRKLKVLCSIPPDESITQMINGRFVAEGYFERNIGVIWSKDTMSRKEFEKLGESLRERGELNPDNTNVIDTTYQPLTTQERALQSAQVTKAALRKGKNLWDILPQIFYGLLIFMFVLVMVIFWDRITKPTLDAAATNAQIIKDISQFQQQNLRLYMMLTGGKGNGTYIVQELPADQVTFHPGQQGATT